MGRFPGPSITWPLRAKAAGLIVQTCPENAAGCSAQVLKTPHRDFICGDYRVNTKLNAIPTIESAMVAVASHPSQ